MPTSFKVKKLLMTVLPKKINGPIYELGSGWATLLFPLSKKYPDSDVIGFETSKIPYYFSSLLLWVLRKRYPKVSVKDQDFFKADLKNAKLIVCYLYPGAMEKLKEKFEKELSQGAFVVTHTFAVPGWNPEHLWEVADLYHTKIYIYRFNRSSSVK